MNGESRQISEPADLVQHGCPRPVLGTTKEPLTDLNVTFFLTM